MVASLTDKFRKVGASTVTTLAAPGKALAAASITVGSTTNYPTDTGIVIGIREVDTDGELVAGTYTEWNATVSSATSFNISTTPRLGSDRVYPAASTTQVFLVVSSSAHNDMIDGILEEHAQDGGHTDITADSITAPTGTITSLTVTNLTVGSQTPSADWTTSVAPNTVTYNGNRSYDLVFNGTNLTGAINPGTRIRTTRAVAAPTQCTSLNGTNQYWVKTSPNKLTFTDDFVVSAWVKLSSYAGGQIVSRFNGTSGWYLNVLNTGQVQLVGFNGGGANYSQVQTYQSVPLNKWVHVALQLDMSAFTATSTTSYAMIDGVDVPVSISRGGTNPTALVQAGNLEVGSTNGGSSSFPGKIAQVAIFNAKVTQATMRGYISQGLTGSEVSLASAYSFNGVATDLNTTTPNDLSVGGGSAVATNADSPFGGQANGTISSTLDYAIVQAGTFSTNTTLTVQVPEGCTIPTSGGVSSTAYSSVKSPYGFPVDRDKHQVTAIYPLSFGTSIVSAGYNTWQGLTAVTVYKPVGKFIFKAAGSIYQANSSSAGTSFRWGFAPTSQAMIGGYEQYANRFENNTATIGNVIATVAYEAPLNLTTASAVALYIMVNGGGGTVNIGMIYGVLTLDNAYL